MILAGVMMLRHLGEGSAADRVERAVKAVLAEGRAVTRDLNPEAGVGTEAMTDAILTAL